MSDDGALTSLGPGEPAAVVLYGGSDDGIVEDEQEWEYEYSTTQTETYYLTIELSYPEFKAPPKPQGLHKTRGGHYKTWLGHANEPGEVLESTTATKRAGVDTQTDHQPVGVGENVDEDDEDEPIPAADADDDNFDIDPSLMSQTYDMDADRREQEKQQAESERQKGERPGDSDRHVDEAVLQPIQDIQVLDLHSKRPFISYRGRVFEGEWAEVVGTELILAGSDGKNRDLPTLRTLPGDVSLLAASCSRILTTEKALKPREPEEDPLAEVRKEWLINIPSGIDKSGERARQASFLEKLIGLKLKKGEPDQVTVYAKEAVGKDFKDHRDPTSRTRRRLQGPDDELNDGSHTVAKKPRLRLTGRHRRGSGRGPLRVIPADEILSVPTPNRWVDLRAHNEDGDEEEAEAEEDEDDEDEDRGAASDDIDSLDEKDVEDEEETERDNNRESQESDSAQLIEEEEEDEDEEDDDDDDEDMGSDASHTKGNDQVKEQEVIMRESG